MKKILSMSIFVLSATLLLYSCTKQSKKDDPAVCSKSVPGTNIFKAKKSGNTKAKTETTVKCDGNCTGGAKCSLEGVYSQTEQYVQCSCDNCTMQVSISKTDSTGAADTTIVHLESGQLTTDYMLKFQAYMAEHFPGQTFRILSVYISNDEFLDIYTVQYEYQTAAGETGTITYQNDETGKNIQIDCKGKCDCRERISPTTGKVSCSCDDCSLEIKVMTDTK